MSDKIVDAINGKSQQQRDNTVATIMETKVSNINEITRSQQFNETHGLLKQVTEIKSDSDLSVSIITKIERKPNR